MTAPIRHLIAGNWKMNGLKAQLTEAIEVNKAISAGVNADVLICPPASLVMVMAEVLKSGPLVIGGQDCHASATGANTGDVSAEMLADAGAKAVILGHSERRADHGETCGDVLAKVKAAHRSGLVAIVCIGESDGQRRAGLTIDVVVRQLKNSLPDTAASSNTVIAYEPVWAIGTGLTPTVAEVTDVHATIRNALKQRFGADGAEFHILYGGSVKPSNAKELMAIANVNGALVGGASLKASDFLEIVRAV